MTNTFYNPSGNPGNHADGLSAVVRAEFASIGVAFDILPQITTTGAFATVFNQQGNYTFTLPAAPGTLAMLSDVAGEASARAIGDTTEAAARTAADALLAPKNAPVFTTSATLSYTLPTLDNSDEAVSSHWVANFLAASGFAPAGTSPVVTVAARTGNVILTHADLTDWTTALVASATPLLRGYISGLQLSNDAVSPTFLLDIAAGTCTDSTNTTTITLGAFTKSIGGAWTAGSGNNGMGVGLVATGSTWYHVYAAIINGVADIFFDTTFPPINSPAGTTARRRIGSFKLGPAVHILVFNQTGDRFDWFGPVLEFNGLVAVTTAVTVTLAGVPPGVPVEAIITGTGSDAVAPSALYLSSLAQADLAPAVTVALTARCSTGVANSYAILVVTDTSARIRRRSDSTTQTITALTNGWIDRRGRG